MDRIVLDAMGGDNAPYATVEGAVQALGRDKNISIILTGIQEQIEKELAKYKYDKNRIEIVDCPDVIGMNDAPNLAIRRDKSSMIAGFLMLKNDDSICGMVTAGSTGSAIVGAQIKLGTIEGVKRSALCPAIPNIRGGSTLLIDCGANTVCKPSMLAQFAVLGTVYAQAGFGIKNPKVGLLNNGTEEYKGDDVHKEALKILSEMKGINFIGNVEGRDIMIGECDVVVSDGFSGNIALKSIEGCGKMILSTLKSEIKSSFSSKIGYLFMKKSLNKMRAKLDFDKFGGALLLGLKKPVVKSHGSSKPETIANSIINAVNVHRNKLIEGVEQLLKNNGENKFE